MRRTQRAVLIVAMLAIAPVLAGCADFDIDKLDVFGINEKKKLPGDRKPLFPEGVPGVSQGIPPEYRMGNRPAETADPTLAPVETPKTAAVAPPEEPPAAKPKPKRVPRPAAASAPTRVTVQPTAQQPPQAQQQQAPASWPEPAPQQPPAQSTAPWPSAPPPGTFSR